jgi:putative transport protein
MIAAFPTQLIESLFPRGSVPSGLATMSLAIAVGIAMGSIRIAGVPFGVAAVLFAGLLFGQLGLSIDPQVLKYFRDFALVLFVYTIGMQLGPGFLASLRAEGLRLNILAVITLVLGAIMAAGICLVFHVPREDASGLFTGGFATTPALAAAQDAMHQLAPSRGFDDKHAVAAVNLAYSVAYPFGLTGPILVVLALRLLFRVNIENEQKQLAACEDIRRQPLIIADIEVTHPSLNGVTLGDRRFVENRGVVFTRIMKGSTQTVPTASTELQVGDVLRAFGPRPAIEELVPMIGQPSKINLAEVGSDIQRAHLIVTDRYVLGRTLRDLDLIKQHGVTLSRINRAGVDLPVRASLKLQFGDAVTAVGPAEGLRIVEKKLGNSTDALSHTQLIPIFIGLWLGVVVGSIPIILPGLHTSIRIGLAGGPMLVAIILSRVGNIGPVVWYMPLAANQALRDFGMAVFLACVGFQSGDQFLQKLIYGNGLPLAAWGALITVVPVTIVALYARLVMRMNFITLSGLVAGAMTSSPTLLFSNETTRSNQPAVAYAAVYPLSMLVPVFLAQLLVTILL